MRYKLYLIIALIAIGNSLLIAGEPHPYLVTIAKDIQLPKESHVTMDLAPNTLTYSFQIQAYTIDSKMRKSYPSSMKEVIGPSNEGFIIRITVAPKDNLPMSRRSGIYSQRNISRPYWKERVYGYETREGTVAVSVQEGLKMKGDQLMSLEEKIREHLARWANKE